MEKARTGYIIRFANDATPATCVKCNQLKNTSEFYTHSVRGDGAVRYRNPCKECRRNGGRKEWSRPIHTEITRSGKQTCKKCKETKPLSEFYCNGCFADGEKKYRSTCKICVGYKSSKRYHQEKDKTVFKKGLSPKNYITFLINKCSLRGRNHTLDINYMLDLYEKQKGLCALSGRPMTHITGKGRLMTNISIDRIDSNIGYIKGNVQLTCLAPNLMKQNMSKEELLNWCLDIVRSKNG
jgi:hypothetical protein